ncbi:hypothetical protein C922_02742 [Plasmodium inui San Antonio 1]|uniref:Uncharacterized protein n=1 Tax=Plasmodium inui San Antonio 1 TaxID=1237626 RepID=W7A0Q3_9APIC|nr:hypothetical protein C922_02742 [Plasmodium inui San Antonio 1]EUD66757.1 hypothetical protein C922_02742 [Plasmodium inui San Antonio 1]
MDKQAIKRRNRLLKKNEARMSLLLGKSEEGDVEKDAEGKKKAGELKPKRNEVTQEEGHDGGEKKLPSTGKNAPSEMDQMATPSNSPAQASIADCDQHTEGSSNQQGDPTSGNEQTPEGKKKEGKDPTGEEKQRSDPETSQKRSQNEGQKGDQKGEIKNGAKKKRISNHAGHKSDSGRDDYTNVDDINNPSESNSGKSEGKGKEEASIGTPQFKLSIRRLAQFASLIFLSTLLSIVKIKYCDYNPLPMSIEPMGKKKKLQRFISSKFVFFFLSLFYNMAFSLIDVYAYFVKHNLSQKELWKNLQNLRERLTSQSECLLFLLNNGTTVAFFFVNVVKTYLLLMFLTHLFDDLLYNFTVRKTWASVPLPAS